MFLPERMYKAFTIILRKDFEKVSEKLIEFGEFEIIHNPAEIADLLKTKRPKEDIERIYSELNNYKDRLSKIYAIIGKAPEVKYKKLLSIPQIDETLKKIEKEIEMIELEKDKIRKQRIEVVTKIAIARLMRDLGSDFYKLQELKNMIVRIATIPAESYRNIRNALTEISHHLQILEKVEDLYIVLLVVSPFNRAEFERFTKLFHSISEIPKITKSPEKYIPELGLQLFILDEADYDLDIRLKTLSTDFAEEINSIEYSIYYHESLLELKNYSFSTETVVILAGWIPKSKIKKLEQEIEKLTDGAYEIIVKEPETEEEVPTKLRNPSIFRPFEYLVNMFGTPYYKEIDPTPIVAITYTLMYGAMFGDFAQGLILALVGLIGTLVLKPGGLKAIMNIAVYVGISSSIFGLLYGTVFGYENIFKPLWISPFEGILTLITVAISFGALMIIIGLILSIINYIFEKDYLKAITSHNGFAGLLLYISLIGPSLYYINFGKLPVPVWVIASSIGLAVLLMILEGYIEKAKGEEMEMSPLAKGFFDLFETLLNFLSNTVSFIRVAAFALTHAALMLTVISIANLMPKTLTGIILKSIILVLGNLFVIGFEGFVVGIQSLRLEYYEFFMKFFRAKGRPFKPLRTKIKELWKEQ